MTPAPRPALRAIALALLLLVQITPVALAVELPYHEELMYDNTVSEAYSVPVSGDPTDYGGAFGFRVADVTKFRAPKIIFIGDAPATMVANPDLQCSGSADVDIKHVDYYYNTAKVGEGRFYYNTHFSGGEPSRVQIWLEITKWNTNYVSTGSATYIITPAFTDLGIGLKHPGKLAPGDAAGKQISVLFTRKEQPGRSERVFPGSYIVEYGQYWESAYTVSQANDETYNVFVDRRNYYSNVSISDTSATYHESYGAQNVTVDVFRYTLEPPLTLKITDPYGNVNLRNLLGDPDPGDPSRVMVHIIAQDARNENLLLDAAVEVRDQNDAVVATGSTSPDGWMVFEYDLPATLADEDFQRYYMVSVSLDGWTQKVTNYRFYPAFIPRSGDWIRVEMLPDTDGPADPEKTYIMFFVRDIHANPLERASIEIAGNFWHTNSAGHVAVEVPKNSTTAYTVRKTGHVSISGSAAVGAEGSYVVNITLGPALPDRTPGPGDDPGGSTPTPTGWGPGQWTPDPGGALGDNARSAAKQTLLEGLEMGQGLFMLCILMIMLTVIRRGGR